MLVKIKDTILNAVIQSRPGDAAWGGRESKAVTFAGTYTQAMELFTNDAAWSAITEAAEDMEAQETDLSAFALAGPVTDNRDGTVTVKMGRYLQSEIIAMTIGAMPKTQTEAVAVRTAIETAVQSLDDSAAAQVISLFPELKQDGTLVKAGTRINWHGKILRAVVDLWDRPDHDPDTAPMLWEGL